MYTVLESIATGNPPLRFAQSLAASLMQRVESLPDRLRRRIPLIYERTSIDFRYTCVEDHVRDQPEEFDFYPQNWALDPPPTTGAFARPDHDHHACVSEALVGAAELCRKRGVRLTGTRQRILELVWAGHRPVGAYELLAALGRDGRPAAPPTVYRALDFLVAQGLVHRIESLNAFVGCPAPARPHRGQFLICRACGASAEVTDRRRLSPWQLDVMLNHAGDFSAAAKAERKSHPLTGDVVLTIDG